ncbi:MAG: PGF-pre-PGF domain-containing protein, partial [Methanocorpusculum sp.]|nr:PGF-pre-PGF domain-containing protein [Methanocorpusculum sp.]
AAKTVVRVFDWIDSQTVATSLTISGGSITSEDGYGVNFNMGNTPGVSFTITGGTITTKDTDYQLAVYIASKGSAENIQIRIDDGEFNGAFAINGRTLNTINPENIAITGGTFNGGSSEDSVVGYGDTEIKFISGGTFANDVSAYVAEDHICISKDETSFEVIEKPAAADIPETVPGVESGSDGSGKSIIKAPTDNVNDKTDDGGFVVISSTKTEVSVSFVITGATVTGGNDGNTVITLGENAEITANYDVQPVSDGTNNVGTFQLSIKIDNVTKPLPVIDATVDKTIMKGHDTPVKSVLAMITALGADRNSNLASRDGNNITIIFTVPISAIDNLNNIAAYHVDKDGIKTKAEMGKPEKSGNEYIIHVHGKHFSSYVLVEEEPEEEEIIHNTGGGKDTGSGNYQYYPRDVPTNGIVDFGTSKVVTGIELPAGSSGKVTLNTKPTFAMPENGFYAFEIDAPGYNLEAKINGGISFKLTVSEIEAAGWTAKDIVLYHGTVAEDGTINWEALPTNLVKNENGIAYYKAAINGCSPFYIGFVKDGSVVNTEVVEPVTPPTEIPDVPGTELPEIPDVQDEPEEPSSPAPLAAVIAALGAAVVLRRK